MSLLSALAAWLPLQTDPSATICGGPRSSRAPLPFLWGLGALTLSWSVEPLGRIEMSTSGQKGLQHPPPKYHLRSGPACPLTPNTQEGLPSSSQASEVLLGKGRVGVHFPVWAGRGIFFLPCHLGLRDLKFPETGMQHMPLFASLGV